MQEHGGNSAVLRKYFELPRGNMRFGGGNSGGEAVTRGSRVIPLSPSLSRNHDASSLGSSKQGALVPWRQPGRQVGDVRLDVGEPRRMLADLVPGRIRDEARAAVVEVPVIVRHVVEAGLGDGPPLPVPFVGRHVVERHGQVECPPAERAVTSRHHGAAGALGETDGPFVGMGREEVEDVGVPAVAQQAITLASIPVLE